jgi:hypothetical protein
MWQLIINAAHFLAEVTLGLLVIVGFVCWVWFFLGLLYYRNHKDLPEYHVQADEHEGMTWWNAWRWSGPDRLRPLKDNVIIESAVFGVAAFLAFIWVLDLIFK